MRVSNSLIAFNTKAAVELSVKINQISELKKDFVCKSLIKLARLNYKIEFLEWYIKSTKLNEENL